LGTALAAEARPAKELLEEWKNGQGGSERTLKRAKQALRVEAYRVEVPGPWWWKLPHKDATLPNCGELGNLGTLAKNTGSLPVSGAASGKDAKMYELGTLDGDESRHDDEWGDL
jgi:hypothetical protein